MQTPDQIIEAWQAAYSAGNKTPAPDMRYKSGWYRTRWNAFRKDEVVRLTKTLVERAESA